MILLSMHHHLSIGSLTFGDEYEFAHDEFGDDDDEFGSPVTSPSTNDDSTTVIVPFAFKEFSVGQYIAQGQAHSFYYVLSTLSGKHMSLTLFPLSKNKEKISYTLTGERVSPGEDTFYNKYSKYLMMGGFVILQIFMRSQTRRASALAAPATASTTPATGKKSN